MFEVLKFVVTYYSKKGKLTLRLEGISQEMEENQTS